MSPTTLLLIMAMFMWRLYGRLTRLPAELADRDVALGDYARSRIINTLAWIGAWLGFGEVAVLTRTVHRVLHGDPERLEYPGVEIKDDSLNGVRVRIYTPEKKMRFGPAMVWIHGGGWCFSSVEADDYLVAEICKRCELTIVSIDYRRAPEHAYPVPLQDCVKACKGLLDNAEKFGFNPDRIAISGASAGGNLAVAVCLTLRDEKYPRQFCLQLPLLPMLQAFDLNTPSYDANQDDGLCPRSLFANCWMWYALGHEGYKLGKKVSANQHIPLEVREEHKTLVSVDLLEGKYVPEYYKPPEQEGDKEVWAKVKDVLLDPHYAPLMAESLKGLPPAYVITAGVDVLRDDGMMYARRLEKAGIAVTRQHYDNISHGHLLHGFQVTDIAKKAMADLAEFLLEKL